MNKIKGIRIGEKEYGIEDSEVREELANVVDGAPEELDSFKEAFEMFKEGGEALAGIGKAVTDEAARAERAENALDDKITAETDRAKEAEGEINQNAIAADSLGYNTTTNDISLEYETLDGQSAGIVTFPAATTEKAGVMSAGDKKKLLKSSIYSPTATGEHAGKFDGIKDLIILHTVNGLYYSVANISKGMSRDRIRLYTSVSTSGEGAVLLLDIEREDDDIDGKYCHYKKTAKTGEVVYATVVWDDLPDGNFTSMWANKYPLADKVFNRGYGSTVNAIYQEELVNGIIDYRLDSIGIDTIVASTKKNEYAVEIGNINYLTGKDASSSTTLRTGHIPVLDKGSIEIITPIEYKAFYVIYYSRGEYVGYSTNTDFTPTTFDSIRLRIDYAENITADTQQNTMIKVLGAGNIYGYSQENFVSAKNNEMFSTEVQIVGQGHIDKSTGLLVASDTFVVTDYIAVYSGQEIITTLKLSGKACVGGYSSLSGEGFVPLITSSYAVSRVYTIVIPEGINYIRLCSEETNSSTLCIKYNKSINFDRLSKVLKFNGSNLETPLFSEKVLFNQNHYFNLSTGKFSSAPNLRSGDYIRVYAGQQLDVTFAGYGNCGIAGFVRKEKVDSSEKSYKILLKLPSPAKEGTHRIIIPEGVNYIKISSVITITPEGTISYANSLNYNFLNKIFNNYDFNGLVELVINKLNCSAINNDYQGFRLNYTLPNEDDKLYLSTDIYNIATRENATDTDLIKAFAPMLFYKMQKVGCFVLYDVENNNRPFIYDVDGNKKYITLTDN